MIQPWHGVKEGCAGPMKADGCTDILYLACLRTVDPYATSHDWTLRELHPVMHLPFQL